MIYEILPVNNHKGNNNTTRFDFDFYIENANQLKVYLLNDIVGKKLLTNDVDYTINELKNPNGSYIIYPKENSNLDLLKENEIISIMLDLPISQETQYTNSSLLNLTSLEYSLDYLTRLIQILSRKTDLSLKVQEGSDVNPDNLIEDIYNKSAKINSQSIQIEKNISDIENKITVFNSTSTNLLDEIIAKSNKAIEDIKSSGFYMRDDKLYFINSQGEEVEFKSGSWGEISGDIEAQSDLNEKFVKYSETDVFNAMIESYVNGTSGYNIWSNGYCEQWGYSIPATTVNTITLLKKYKDTNYNVSLGPSYTSNASGTNVPFAAVSKTINTFSIYTASTNHRVYWKTAGYLAQNEYTSINLKGVKI